MISCVARVFRPTVSSRLKWGTVKQLLVLTGMALSVGLSAQFTAGRVVVLQAGDGASALVNTGNPIVLREFQTTGTPGITVTVPSTGPTPMIIGGTGTTEGNLSLSGDATRLVFSGYAQALPNATVLSSSAAATINRAVGSVNAGGTFTRNFTSASFFSANSIRGGASDGTNYWATGGNDGTDYFGPGTAGIIATGKTNLRASAVFNGQLYVSSASAAGTPANAGVFAVGTGLPTTTGQTLTTLVNSGSTVTNGFFLSPSGTVLYVTIGTGGIQKWTFSAGWTLAYTMTFAAGANAVVADMSGANPILYAVNNAGSQLIRITDPNGGTGSVPVTPTTLATAAANTAFRGIAFAPSGAPPVGFALSSSSVAEGGTATVGVTMNTAPASNVVVTVSDAGTGSATSASDYNTFASTQLTFLAAGSYPQTQNVSVVTIDDAAAEPSETVNLSLAVTSGPASLGTSSHALTITDNDGPAAEPTVPSTLSFIVPGTSSITVGMSGGNGASRILVIRAGSAVTFSPTDATTYAGANSDISLAANLGSLQYLVFNGAGTSVTVTGLSPSTIYHFAAYEYNGTGAQINYLSTAGTGSATTMGPILYGGGTYTQNFDGLPSAGSPTVVGAGPFYLGGSPVNGSNLVGWQFAKTGGSGADAKFTVDAGTSTSGSVYSYGTGTASDRALGSLSAGAVASAFGAVIQNTSAQVYTSVTISYTGEQWRIGGGIVNSLAFQYAVGGTNLTTGTFTAESNLNFNAPENTVGPPVQTLNSAVNGNLAINQATVTYTLQLNQNWNPGQTLVIRWNDIDDTGNDDGIAIDGMSFSAAGVTAPTTQDFNIVASNTLTVSSDIGWTNGDGSRHLVILNTVNSFTNPTNGTEPTANSVYGGSGEQVVYNGTGNAVNVTGLLPATQYFARVYGFNGTGTAATYITSTATDNPNNFTTATPVPPTKLVITSLNGGNPILEDTPFSITVQTQDGANSPQDVTAPTTITITLNTGFGTLSGTLSGVINTGNTVTISGILYDTPESGVILDANVTSGPSLTGTSTAPFEVFGIATSLSFSPGPGNGVVNQPVGNIEVQALRDDFSVDVNYTGAITISVFSGSGTMNGTLTQNAVAGVATFTGISFTAADTYVLEANATGLTPGNSSPIIITLPPTMTELVVPQYMGSKSASGTNANRTPFAVCLQFNNLVPNASYDLRGGVALTSDVSTTFGAANIWNGTTYGTTNLLNYFTADGSGSSGPVWLYIQPTANATRFDAGQVHNLRISIGINGQGVPITPTFISTKTITALDIATSARTPATTDDGAYVRGTSVACASGKLVLIYNNTAGTGDPMSVFQVRTTTPSDVAIANYSGHPAAIGDIYLQTGTSNVGDYPGVVPIGANNANGVQRIELRNLDNTLFNAITDADGIWPGGANFTTIARRAVGQIGLPADPTLSTVPSVTPGTYGPACSNDPDIALGGTPANGVWTGTGVSGSYVFSPSAGSQTLTYTYTDANNCFATGTTSITVNTAPVITCPADFTVCSSDAPFALTGGLPIGGTYSGTGVSGANFDPSQAAIGANLITYNYTDGNNCTNTPCTFTITVTQATAWYSDQVDGDGLGDPNASVMACGAPSGYVADNTDLCPLVSGTVGSACNDNNPFTTGDVLNASCACVGTPVPCDNWTLVFNLDASPAQTTWQMVDATSPFVLASGGPYSSPNSSQSVTICVPQGACFKLTVNDGGNNGIAGGGWMLLDNTGKRIVDNVANGGDFTSTTTTGLAFCNEPASTQTLIASHCDRENWIISEVIIASANTAVSAQWGVGNQTDDGYQFWFEDPLGGYSRRIFRDHATSGGNGPADAIRATKLKLSSMVTFPLPVNKLLNVRVRARVNGVDGAWGPACRFRVNPNSCTPTKLNDVVSDPNYSCGVTGKVVGAGGQAGKIYAKVVYSNGSPATNYRFKLSQAGEGYTRMVTMNNAVLQLTQWVTTPLLCGTYSYDVQVAASFDGGSTFCPYGDVCTVGITNNIATHCTTPGNFAGGNDRMAEEDAVAFEMYPNPNNGDQLFISMSELADNVSTVSMDMFDIFGQKVMTRTLIAQNGAVNTVIDLDKSMASGLYLVNITASGVTRTERLVIQH